MMRSSDIFRYICCCTVNYCFKQTMTFSETPPIVWVDRVDLIFECYHVMSCHSMSCNVMSCLAMSCLAVVVDGFDARPIKTGSQKFSIDKQWLDVTWCIMNVVFIVQFSPSCFSFYEKNQFIVESRLAFSLPISDRKTEPVQWHPSKNAYESSS